MIYEEHASEALFDGPWFSFLVCPRGLIPRVEPTGTGLVDLWSSVRAEQTVEG
jgi:hypothetical protein